MGAFAPSLARELTPFEPAAGAAGHVPYRGTGQGRECDRPLPRAARKDLVCQKILAPPALLVPACRDYGGHPA